MCACECTRVYACVRVYMNFVVECARVYVPIYTDRLYYTFFSDVANYAKLAAYFARLNR